MNRNLAPCALALLLTSCADRDPPPLAPMHARVQLSLRAQTATFGALGAASVRLRAGYRRTDGASRALDVTPSSITLSSDTFAPTASIDAGPCITDPFAGVITEDGTVSGCFLEVHLVLLDANLQPLDSVVVRPVNAVERAGTIDVGTVTLGGATVIALTPVATTLLPGDSVQIAVATRTGTGITVTRPVTYATSDAGVATVSATGRIQAAGRGTANITVTADGNSVQLPVTVRAWNNAESALLATTAIASQTTVTTGFGTGSNSFEGLALAGGLLADEWLSGDTFSERFETDRRTVSAGNLMAASLYRQVLQSLNVAPTAEAAYTNFVGLTPTADSLRAVLGQMYLVQGLAELMTAEAFCAGTAFIVVDSLTARRSFGAAETTDETFARAADSFTRALGHGVAAGTSPLAPLVVSSARLGRARAHLNRARYAEARVDAAAVPQAFVVVSTHADVAGARNGIWVMNVQRRGYSVANLEGGTGLAFRAAADPRLPVTGSGFLSFDGVTPHFQQFLYTTAAAPVPIGSGVEAALIRAEALVATGDATGAGVELNALRAVAGLPVLGGATTLDVVMSERAFWLFGTGRRLADLRRLVRQYGRNPAVVFPSGAYHKGGLYGTDVNFPISDPGQQNPNYRGCLNRDA